MTAWEVRPVRAEEFEPWSELFAGYAAFYRWPTSPEHQREIWRWIHEDHSVEALVVAACGGDGNEVGRPQGLAHLREWVRPLRGVRCGYLDDLFVAPDARGAGAAQALFAAINRIAVDRAWSIVRWTTADDNYRARTVYDQVATRTTWITYDMEPNP